MFRTLFARLSGALVALSLVLSIALALVLQSSHQSFHLETEQRQHQQLAQRLVARFGGGEALDAMFDEIRRLAVLNPAVAAYAVGQDGVIVASSRPAHKIKRPAIAMTPVLAFIQGPVAWPALGDDPAKDRGQAIFSAAPMASTPAPAYLYVVLGGADNNHSLLSRGDLSYSLREALVLTVANVAAALIATMVVVAFITRPLRRLRRAMEAFDAAQFAGGARYRSAHGRGARDEIDRLGEIFDSMADRIALQMESLRHSEQARRELYANVSHDLETPLTSLHGYVETLLAKDAVLPAAERTRYLRIVHRQSERLRELVDQITDLARLEMPGLRLQLQDVSLPHMLQHIVEDLKPLLAQKDLKTHLDAQPPAPSVQADPGLLRRALANIVLNAIQASPEGSEIGLGVARESDERVVVTVTDQGPGLAEDDIRRIFEPHFRGSRDVRPGTPGMGLGLAIARKVAELHGGTLAASNAPKGGAVLRMTLPM